MVEAAGERRLEPDELKILQEALRNHEPWLEWSGKREQQWCVADPVALHIHERVSTQAILRVAKREDVQRDLFADPEMEYRQAVQFYKWPMDWTNRMILGDSLAVMASLARREGLAGKVQMIYMDPPYGIKYASNFQPEVGRRDVKDKDEDLTREPEMVKAYRDTWTLGVHSYLSYLRDRLLLCKELLADTGSIFVQISDENFHRVRVLMDEVFRAENFISVIGFRKTSNLTAEFLPTSCDFLLWYSRDRAKAKYRQLFVEKSFSNVSTDSYGCFETSEGFWRRLSGPEKEAPSLLAGRNRLFGLGDLTSSHYYASPSFEYEGREFTPKSRYWSTSAGGLARVSGAGRIAAVGDTLRYKRFFDDFPVMVLNSQWDDTGTGTQTEERGYVVQTATKVVARCLLMTTDPGDLVLDPTCGSGTTAYVAENWGRRWITIDCSRVALAIARQRLLTAKYDYYQLRPTSAEDVQRNPGGPWLSDPEGKIQGTCTFDCKTVPHVTLKSIAQNQALDPIFEKWEPVLSKRLVALNDALAETVTDEIRQRLKMKIIEKEKREGKKAVTDADRRRWVLPEVDAASRRVLGSGGDAASTAIEIAGEASGWREWEVPFDTDPDWPRELQEALTEYRKAWRGKMDEVNACIAARADQEELVDQPSVDRSKVRVSGPFTVEGVIPEEESIEEDQSPHPHPLPEGEGDVFVGARPHPDPLPEGEGVTPIGGAPEELETFEGSELDASAAEGREESLRSVRTDARNADAYLDRMIRLLREDGVRFPDNKVVKFGTLEALADGSILHAVGTWGEGAEERRAAVMFGPQYGALVTTMVEDGIRTASRRGYDDLVFAAFSFDSAAQATIQDDPDPRVRIHMAQIRPDVTMGDLLKTTVSSQIFTVSGMPRTEIKPADDGQFVVEMQGVDIYDPVTNTVRSTGAEKVAAWFLDTDYDGRCFCITQAFFPDRSSWDKLSRALKGTLDPEAFDKLSGTVSLPFPAGQHRRVAVKVIDPRGNEVVRIHRLGAIDYREVES
ncbi:site-specific DNA-methyltransferase [Candidatus Fermentibacteria bacterium]|nr:site-specific DNA-methyltransferase [Candidatus Fermentibacteria bacterium]